MADINRGDIVLVPFPFTNLKAHNVRPAIIVSPRISVRGDVIVGFISSVVPLSPSSSEIVLKPGDRFFSMSGLKRASVFRMDKVVTLHQSLILRQLGHIPLSLQRKVDKALTVALGLR